MPRTLPRLLTPFRVQRPDTPPGNPAGLPLPGAPLVGAPLSDRHASEPAGSAHRPGCRGDAPLPPCGLAACPPAGCAGSAPSVA